MNRMKELRQERNITMKEAADALHMPYTTYVNYEKGVREPNSETLIKIADFYETSIDYLLCKADAEFRNQEKREGRGPSELGNEARETDIGEEIVIINRAAKRMTPEKRKKLLEMARIMFEEDFKDNE